MIMSVPENMNVIWEAWQQAAVIYDASSEDLPDKIINPKSRGHGRLRTK